LLLVLAFAIGSATFWQSVHSSSTLPSGESNKTSASMADGKAFLALAAADEDGNEEIEGATYDPMAFDALLGSYVSNGLVNYKALTNNEEFTDFVGSLKESTPSGMTTDGQLAFWVNAYNACVISNVIAHPKIKGPLEVDGFFDKVKFDVAGQQLTLNEIENTIVRPTFKEPLIHFGLVCAARSCPPLIPKAYTEANVREELAANARNYLADKKQNRFDAKSGKLSLSKIFEWYKADFGGDDAGLIAFAKQYGPEEMRAGLEKAKKVTVAFVEYDWTLNGQ
ncbi:MAG: DUF547 domain-containing protein, partial [Candidatus Kapaibacterium sp.]